MSTTMSKAMLAVWAFATKMVEKHGMTGDDTMTDAEHQEWQEASTLCNQASVEAAQAIKNSPSNRTTSLTFARREDGSITTLGILDLRTTLEDDEEVFEALTAAITQWIRTTEEGRQAWAYSSNDFNIGDLVGGDHHKNPDLKRLLAERGIEIADVTVADSDGDALDYDTVLVNQNELPGDDDDGARP